MTTKTESVAGSNSAGAGILERRAFPRYPILQRCFVCSGPRRLTPWGPEGWRSIAYNISRTGIGLTLPLPIQPGIILEIEPWGLPVVKTVRGTLVRCTQVEFLWFCGCRFEKPLQEEELRAWMGGSSF